MALFIGWIVFSVLIGLLGSSRSIGFGWAFALSLFLSPLIGGLFTLTSPAQQEAEFKQRLLDVHRQPGPQGPPTPAADSLDQQLRKLAALRVDGLLSEAEFDAQRRRLLGY